MDWKTMLAYVTGSVDEELLGRNEYLVAENRILRGRCLLGTQRQRSGGQAQARSKASATSDRRPRIDDSCRESQRRHVRHRST